MEVKNPPIRSKIKSINHNSKTIPIISQMKRKNIALLAALLTVSSVYGQQNQLVKEPIKGDFPKGLSGRHIAMWHSHGYYYESKLDRWEWQRARCFSNVEDIGNMPYVVKYLEPMLENAGAVTLIPRERDYQKQKFVVDNDLSTKGGTVTKQGTWKVEHEGYKYKAVLYPHDNPFKMGTHLEAKTSSKGTASLSYKPHMAPSKKGDYAVYISWANTPSNVSDVTYKVYHTGGVSEFVVNQKMYGETWQYLGTFNFDSAHAAVVVSNRSNEKGVVTSDAVRFGGGMGMVARRPSALITDNAKSSSNGAAKAQSVNPDDYDWKTSGVPSYLEASRYYLQAAGIPDSIYSRTKYQNDYNDDYQSRPHWANFLKKHKVPIDLTLAFHTDAGATPNDSIVGTLAIYSTKNGNMSDGRSRQQSGIMGNIIQTQICNDIQQLHNSKWTKRALRDAQYSEASVADAPTLLLELLSHQNMADMIYGLDPRFRFTVARAIYKGMARYLNGADAPIQPLAPNSLAIEKGKGKTIRLSWKNTQDPLEPTANAAKYRIYMRTNDNGFSPKFKEVTGESAEIELPEWGTRYAFKVTGVNDGGESFATEQLSACLFNNSQKPALIVNGFTRISAPKSFDLGAKAGFEWWEDEGVADGMEPTFLGYQQAFNRSEPWLDDDNTGWGSSGVEWWGNTEHGNTHDFTHAQGRAYQKWGVSYVSASRAAFEKCADVAPYRLIDVLFGEQRTVKNFREERDSFAVFTPKMVEALDKAVGKNIPLLLSGAYIGTDMVEQKDSVAIKFTTDKLGFRWMANHASNTGVVYATDNAKPYINGTWSFNGTTLTPEVLSGTSLRIEAPDAIEPTGKAIRIMRYRDTQTSAGTLLKANGSRVVAFGFPLEAIPSEAAKNVLMKQLFTFFGVELKK
jgi:hypothetical protein